jgi:predicted nucleotidyltransferase
MSIKTLTEIKGILKKHETELKKRYGIKKIGIFGSYLRGEAREKSDLDILVEFEQGVDIRLLKFVGMENYLSDLLGVKVDLVEKSALKPRIGKYILKEVVYPLKKVYPEIPRREMAGMRDKLIHEYFGVNLKRVWKTVKEEIPPLKPLFEKILRNLEK